MERKRLVGVLGGERGVRFRARKGTAMQYTEYRETLLLKVYGVLMHVSFLYLFGLLTPGLCFFCHTKIWIRLAPESSKE